MIFVFARAATYSALFIGFLLVFLPGRILARTGITQPPAIGGWQIVGIILGAAGAALASRVSSRSCSSDGARPRHSIRRGGWWCGVPIASCATRCTSAPPSP